MNEKEFIAQMNRNQRIMIRIDKVFFITGFLCVIINGVMSLFEIILIPVNLIDGNPFSLLEGLLAPVSVVLSVLSSCKREKWTIAALGVFLLRVLLILISTASFTSGAAMFFLFALPQFLCMRQYEKLSVLKWQFGYPGFNSEIYMHKPRRSSGHDYSSRTRRSKAKKASRSAGMDDIDPPPTGAEYEDIFTNRRKPL
ncbi:MAG: hypothetical protein MSJ26_03110 [Oscillospiraceae bacterium]|nr:hypothetical protein [Oscillospiraceae bacterium]